MDKREEMGSKPQPRHSGDTGQPPRHYAPPGGHALPGYGLSPAYSRPPFYPVYEPPLPPENPAGLPKVWQSALLYSAVVLGMSGTNILLMVLGDSLGVWYNFLAMPFLQIMFLAILTVLLLVFKVDWKRTLRLTKPKPVEMLLAAATALLLIPVSGCLSSIVLLLVGMLFGRTEVPDISSLGFPPLVMFACMCVVPAIVEELMFRGAIQRGMERVGTMKGVVLTGLLFGLMHMDFQRFIGQALIGMVMAYVVMRTGSIVNGMIMHFVNNVIPFLLLYVFSGASMDIQAQGDIWAMVRQQAPLLNMNTTLFTGLMMFAFLLGAVFYGAIAYIPFSVIKKRTARPRQTMPSFWESKKGLWLLLPGLLLVLAQYILVGYLLSRGSVL